MVEPSEELQLVFDKAIKDAKKLKHEYVTLEHLLFAMLCSEKFYTLMQGADANVEYVKANLEHYLKNDLSDITLEPKTKYKPKKIGRAHV